MSSTNDGAVGLKIDTTIPPVLPTEGAEGFCFPKTSRAEVVSTHSQVGEVVFIARGLSKIYRMGDIEIHALRSVNLELYEGELLVLLGASGSGKSTLLNILGGLDVPTSGEVFYRDHNLTIDDDAELTRYRREHVGFVFQFYNLIPSLTALENVELVIEPSAFTKVSALGIEEQRVYVVADLTETSTVLGETAIGSKDELLFGRLTMHCAFQ
jgi:ABC-type sugar transport system ATPase subunit